LSFQLKMIGAELSDAEKTKIASDIVLQSPPGEFNEVFNDVRTLLNDDTLLDKGCLEAVKQYNKSQFVTVKLDGVEQSVGSFKCGGLISDFSCLSSNFFSVVVVLPLF